MQHVFRPVNLGVCQRGLRHRRPKCSWLELQRAPFTFFKSVFLVTTARSLKPASKSRCTAHGVQVGNTGASLSPDWLLDPLSRLHDKLSDSPCRMSNPSAQRPACCGGVREFELQVRVHLTVKWMRALLHGYYRWLREIWGQEALYVSTPVARKCGRCYDKNCRCPCLCLCVHNRKLSMDKNNGLHQIEQSLYWPRCEHEMLDARLFFCEPCLTHNSACVSLQRKPRACHRAWAKSEAVKNNIFQIPSRKHTRLMKKKSYCVIEDTCWE